MSNLNNDRLMALCAERDDACRDVADLSGEYGEYGASPLEITFAWAMSAILEEFGGGRVMGNGPTTLKDVEIEHGYGVGNLMSSYHLHIWSQVGIGKYTADFLIAYRPGRRDIRYLVIECDGHDFHERTKEQAEHDRRRDREMQSMGIPVLRVTGAEVWRSPVKAAFDVLAAATKVLEVRND